MPPPPSAPTPTLSWTGDRYLRVAMGTDTSLETHRRVRAAFERLHEARIPGVLDITTAYATLLISFDLSTLDPRAAESAIDTVVRNLPADHQAVRSPLLEIPVCYEGPCAPDTDEVARLCNLSPNEVAALHCGTEYTVYFVGFAPGFPYLGGLPPQLNTPRLERPRMRIPPGSVAIAGDQTGIYPQQSPGGWRVIGRTPRQMFDPRRRPASLLVMGDRVRFMPIGLAEFRELTLPRPATTDGGW